MAITQDGLALDHRAQVDRLCAAGARWIQLRMKRAAFDVWLATARAAVTTCRAHGAVCVINDNVDIALASGADGVHLGKLDLDWSEARSRLGPNRFLGGTVNDASDVGRVHAAGCLDYVGVGPLHLTRTKENLAPVLGLAGVRDLVTALGDMPAWVIGGVEVPDLSELRATGAAGAAVSSALFRDQRIEENFRAFVSAWGSMAEVKSTL